MYLIFTSSKYLNIFGQIKSVKEIFTSVSSSYCQCKIQIHCFFCKQVFTACFSMLQANETTASVVTEFFIVGFPGLQPKYYSLIGALLFIIYIAVITGNSLIVILFVIERSLHKPMYIIMLSLSLSDMVSVQLLCQKLFLAIGLMMVILASMFVCFKGSWFTILVPWTLLLWWSWH